MKVRNRFFSLVLLGCFAALECSPAAAEEISEGRWRDLTPYMENLELLTLENEGQSVVLLPGDNEADLDLKFYNAVPVPAEVALSIELPEGLECEGLEGEVTIPARSYHEFELHLEKVGEGPSSDEEHEVSLVIEALFEEGAPSAVQGRAERTLPIVIPKTYAVKKTRSAIKVDGNLVEWTDWTFDGGEPEDVRLEEDAYTGTEDCLFRFGVAYDDKYLYVAVDVIDDKLFLTESNPPWEQDGVEVRLKPDPRTDGTEDGQGVILLAVCPGGQGFEQRVQDEDELPEGTLVASVAHAKGHATEIAVPAAALKKEGEWEEFRLNVAVDDFDDEENGAQLWWNTDWRRRNATPGSGWFVRE